MVEYEEYIEFRCHLVKDKIIELAPFNEQSTLINKKHGITTSFLNRYMVRIRELAELDGWNILSITGKNHVHYYYAIPLDQWHPLRLKNSIKFLKKEITAKRNRIATLGNNRAEKQMKQTMRAEIAATEQQLELLKIILEEHPLN